MTFSGHCALSREERRSKMKNRRVKKAPGRYPSRKGKARKATEREAVEATLDAIAFRRELLDGIRALSGLQIDPIR
jgi:hypothetical protein